MNKKNNVSIGNGGGMPHSADSAKPEKVSQPFSERFRQTKEAMIGPRAEDASQAETLSKDVEKLPIELPGGVKDEPLEEMKRVKEFYKEFVAIGKDTLDVGWKLAPLAFLPAGLFLWVYLRSIHWTGLFQDSAMAVSGLVFLFVATLLLAFAVLLQFVAPSVLLICTVSGYAQDRLMPKYVANIYRWALVGWLIGVSLIIWWDSSNGKWVALALPIVTSLIYLFVYTWKERNLLRGWSSLAWFMKNAGWSLTATFTVAATSLPLVIGLQIAGHVPDITEGWQTWVAMGVCIGISAISLVPGFMYLGARTSSMGAYRPMKFAIGGVVFISYVVISGVAFFAPVSSTVLRLSGIYSNELRTFQVREPTLTPAFAAVGLNVTKKEDLTLVRAYLRYGFGGYKLLCAAPFNPATVSQEAVKKARLDKKPDPGIVGGSHCAPAYPNEVREIRE